MFTGTAHIPPSQWHKDIPASLLLSSPCSSFFHSHNRKENQYEPLLLDGLEPLQNEQGQRELATSHKYPPELICDAREKIQTELEYTTDVGKKYKN